MSDGEKEEKVRNRLEAFICFYFIFYFLSFSLFLEGFLRMGYIGIVRLQLASAHLLGV